MANKSLDGTFLHYGIRQDDMSDIEKLCESHELDFEWVKEKILKAYHEKRVDKIEMTQSDTESVIKKAIDNLEGEPMEGQLW